MTYTFNFERDEDEVYYEVFVQLGDSDLLVSPSVDQSAGVGVNLLWASPARGMTNHEGFGYVNQGVVTETAVICGAEGYNAGGYTRIVVTVDMDSNTYDISLSGAGLISGSGVSGVAFDNDVDIDTIRIYLDGVNEDKFDDLEIDEISLISV